MKEEQKKKNLKKGGENWKQRKKGREREVETEGGDQRGEGRDREGEWRFMEGGGR